MLKKSAFLGLLSTLFYVIHVILGGILWKGYNHIVQPVSDLTAAGAPNRDLILVFTTLYSICGLLFSAGAFLYWRKSKIRFISISMVLYVLMAMISLSYSFFPQDMPGTAMTFRGVMHIAVTGLIVPVAILYPLFAGLGFRKLQGYKKFSIYSIVTSMAIFVSGGTSVIFIANKVPFFGLVERINLGSIQLWTVVLAILTLVSDRAAVQGTNAKVL